MDTTHDAGNATRRFLKKRAMAEHLGISTRTLDRWMRGGLVPYIKTSAGQHGHVIFNVASAERAVGEMERRGAA